MTDHAGLIERLSAIVGATHAFAGDAIDERYRTDIQNKSRSHPAVVLRPASSEEVAAIIRACADAAVPVTALGGGTGLVGGALAEDDGVLLSLERMNRVIEVDPVSMTMTVEAGTPIQVAQDAAQAAGLFLPIDLGARGSATVGGAIATNAGGTRVLRWGMMRDMVLGLEAVLANGAVVSALAKYLKNNTGYDWKQLLVGSEGTLGIVTRAVLRLRAQPLGAQTALIAAPDFASAALSLRKLQERVGDTLSSFELMWSEFYDFISEAQLPQRPRPLPTGHAVYILVETLGGNPDADAAALEAALAGLLDEGLAVDVVIAQSARQRDDLWALREDIMEPMARLKPRCAFDVSMALSDMERFVAALRDSIDARLPGARLILYGHAGDGNLHVAVAPGEIADGIGIATELVYSEVRRVAGSVSAEHGIGRYKKPYIGFTRSAVELDLMRRIKRALDPRDLLNPGKVLPDT